MNIYPMKYVYFLICVLFLQLHLYSQVDPCDEISIPNIFTPNKDGFNDFFIISCIYLYPENKFTIYDRWGQQVYYATGYDNNWSGTWEKTGGDLPDGSYVYLLNYNKNNEEITLRGTITIKR